ncbi:MULTISPECIES: hypothetical protein [unclassified Actinobaculum]|uniref:hypothetical protein n=1 Tax=unclassified Actinobaculum TaxID=2609299 RepID=UPI00196B28DF|nr:MULTISPECIES: hypothetical protein [unclassified Actinobaculum]
MTRDLPPNAHAVGNPARVIRVNGDDEGKVGCGDVHNWQGLISETAAERRAYRQLPTPTQLVLASGLSVLASGLSAYRYRPVRACAE